MSKRAAVCAWLSHGCTCCFRADLLMPKRLRKVLEVVIVARVEGTCDELLLAVAIHRQEARDGRDGVAGEPPHHVILFICHPVHRRHGATARLRQCASAVQVRARTCDIRARLV